MKMGKDEEKPRGKPSHKRLTKTLVAVLLGITSLYFMVSYVYQNSQLTRRQPTSILPSRILLNRSLPIKLTMTQPTQTIRIVNSNSTHVRGATKTTLLNRERQLRVSDSEPSQNFKESSETYNSSPSTRETTRNRDDGKYDNAIINDMKTDNNEDLFVEPGEVISSTFDPLVNVTSNTTDTCTPVTKIIYIKTHKTGSTTTASIFQRFGYRRNLLFALPKVDHVFSNEKLFSRNLIKPWPTEFAKSHPYYDLLVNHARYNRPELERVVPNATYVTILRDPVAQLESAFGYFEMAKGMGLSKERKPFEIFMNNPLHYYTTKKYYMKSRSRNGQLFDLGFDPKLGNDTNAIRAKIDTIDKEFDLVMITDYYDESLILLRKLLCWSFDDIVYISNGIRSQSNRYTISNDLQDKIRQWNAGDVLLYNHFNETFWRKVKEYGPDFQTDLEKYRRLEKELFEKCIIADKIDIKSNRREARYMLNSKENGTYCQDVFRGDVGYTALLKKKQNMISMSLSVFLRIVAIFLLFLIP